MPKMKTHRGAAKRFKKTGTGKLKRVTCLSQATYLLTNLQKQNVNFVKLVLFQAGDYKRIRHLLDQIK